MKSIDTVSVLEPARYVGKEGEKWTLMCVDFLTMIASFWFVRMCLSLTRQESSASSSLSMLGNRPALTHTTIYLLLTCLVIIVFWLKGHYSKRRPFWTETREVLKTLFIIALIDSAFVLFGKLPFSRAALLLNWILSPVFLVIMRTVVKYAMIQLGGWIRPMVIIGWGENVFETAKAFEDEPLMGYQVLAFLIPQGKEKFASEYVDKKGRQIPFVALGMNPASTLVRLGNPHVVLALESGGLETCQKTVQQLIRTYHDMQIVPSLRGLPLYGMEVSHFFSHEVLLLTVRNNLVRRGPKILKRCFDVAVSASVLLLGSPILLWIAFRVAGSKGPIFYGHNRVGQDGKTFACYKFRTMLPNATELLQELLDNDPEARAEWDRDFKLKNDPRITPIGHVLRKTSLDELPQLWNVLKGEMSLVGPRPIVQAELERYGDQVDYYLKAKPGITGLWQISGRNDISYDSRVFLDAWYVKNWSFFTDVVILLKTVKVIFRREGAY